MTRPTAVVFAYSLVGHEALGAVYDAGWSVPLVVTHEDSPGENIWFPSVAKRAREAGSDVRTPGSAKDPELLEELRRISPDFLLSFYFRWMLPVALLETAGRGAYNLHGSLLPSYRGKASIHWQILRGEKKSGVSLHRMVERADAGGLVAQRELPIGPDETALELTGRVARLAADLLGETLPLLAAGTTVERPMDLAAGSYFGGRKPEDGRIDWHRSAREVHDLVRAVGHPFPGAFTDFDGRKLFVWSSRVADESTPMPKPGRIIQRSPLVVSCGQGALEIIAGQFESGEELPGSLLPLNEAEGAWRLER